MISEYVFRPLFISEWEEAMRLAWDTFLLYEAPEYSKEGIKNFKNFIKDPVLKKLFVNGAYHTIAAFYNGLMVGIIGLRNENHISLLFVDRDFHRKGIAKRLVHDMEHFVSDKYNVSFLTVNSSPYAREFYHKIGFIDTNVELVADGIRYTPMKKDIFY